MSLDPRSDRELSDLFVRLDPGPTPDYRDDIVRETARTRQRPAWTLPERWIPMSTLTSSVAARSPVPLRAIAAVALLILALTVGLIAVAGSRSTIPAPFGRAGNGSIIYDVGGDIFAADPVTGRPTVLVSGPDTDRGAVWSLDGTSFVAERTLSGSEYIGRLFVRSADGSHPVMITPDGLYSVRDYAFAPDGRTVVLVSGQDDATQAAWIAQVDGSGIKRIDLPMTIDEVSFLPPDGHALILTARPAGSTQDGIYRFDPTTGAVRPIIEARPDVGIGWVRASPDGSRIAYSRSDPTVQDRNSYVAHVVGADGAGDQALPMPAGTIFQDAPTWSNDGLRLAVTRGYANRNTDMVVAAIPADGSGTGVQSGHGITGCCDTMLEWAPDDSSVLVTPEDRNSTMTEQLLFDPSTGATHPATWTATSPPAWQRRAP
jgi:WD40-like Beta Propeller Repeat